MNVTTLVHPVAWQRRLRAAAAPDLPGGWPRGSAQCNALRRTWLFAFAGNAQGQDGNSNNVNGAGEGSMVSRVAARRSPVPRLRSPGTREMYAPAHGSHEASVLCTKDIPHNSLDQLHRTIPNGCSIWPVFVHLVW